VIRRRELGEDGDCHDVFPVEIPLPAFQNGDSCINHGRLLAHTLCVDITTVCLREKRISCVRLDRVRRRRWHTHRQAVSSRTP
jgi:hypothetical protein